MDVSSLSNSNEYVSANKVLKTQRFSDLQKQKLLGDTILILKVRKNGAERELLNLSELFRKPSTILVGGFLNT